MVGSRFGYLTVVLDDQQGGVKRKVLVECDCGNRKRVSVNNLRTGNTKSCGCYKLVRIREGNITHGCRYTRLYDTWRNMKSRCSNKNNKGYRYYGGNDISVCEEWLDFKQFKNWAMINGYDDNLTIDRSDCNKGYNPTNCTWVPQSVNSKKMWTDSGKRVVMTHHIIFTKLLNSFGISISKCARSFNIKPHTLIAAVNRTKIKEEITH